MTGQQLFDELYDTPRIIAYLCHSPQDQMAPSDTLTAVQQDHPQSKSDPIIHAWRGGPLSVQGCNTAGAAEIQSTKAVPYGCPTQRHALQLLTSPAKPGGDKEPVCQRFVILKAVQIQSASSCTLTAVQYDDVHSNSAQLSYPGPVLLPCADCCPYQISAVLIQTWWCQLLEDHLNLLATAVIAKMGTGRAELHTSS